MTNLEAKKALSKELGIDYATIANSDQFSDDDFQVWLNLAVLRSWDRHPWDFTEGDKKWTFDSTIKAAGYQDYPQDIVTGSANRLMVSGVEFRKLSFPDYLKFRSDWPNETTKCWAEHKRWIFVNPNAYALSDEGVLFGKLHATQLSADSDLLPFSPATDNNEHSGNYAIVLLAKATALGSEKMKNPEQSRYEEARALGILDSLWLPLAQQRAFEQPARPMFDVPDLFANGSNPVDSSPIGNFNFRQ